MAKITDIKPQKNKKRFNIYLDNHFGLAVSAESLVKKKLEIGQEISAEEIEKLRNEDLKGKLYERMLRFLSYRPRSEKEMRDYADGKLARRNRREVHGITEIVDEVIERLKKQGLIDDWEFAKWWQEQRLRFQPRGKMALKIELKQKGISEEIIREILEGTVDELKLAKKAIRKKLKKWQKLDSPTLLKKISQYLFSRGFSWEVIKKYLQKHQKNGKIGKVIYIDSKLNLE